jgi:hypothetical protein
VEEENLAVAAGGLIHSCLRASDKNSPPATFLHFLLPENSVFSLVGYYSSFKFQKK